MFPYQGQAAFLSLLKVLDKRKADILARKSNIYVTLPKTHYRGKLIIVPDVKRNAINLRLDSWGRESVALLTLSESNSSTEFSHNANLLLWLNKNCTKILDDGRHDEFFDSSSVTRVFDFDTKLYLHEDEFNFSLDLMVDNKNTKSVIQLCAGFMRMDLESSNQVSVNLVTVESLSVYFEDIIEGMNKSPFFWKNFNE